MSLLAFFAQQEGIRPAGDVERCSRRSFELDYVRSVGGLRSGMASYATPASDDPSDQNRRRRVDLLIETISFMKEALGNKSAYPRCLIRQRHRPPSMFVARPEAQLGQLPGLTFGEKRLDQGARLRPRPQNLVASPL